MSAITDIERQQSDEIERLNKCIKWEQNYMERIGTHGPGCFKWGPSHWAVLCTRLRGLIKLYRRIYGKFSNFDRAYLWLFLCS